MKIILLLISFLVSGTAFSQSDCQKFKTGKFQNIKNGIVTTQIERSDSIQIETFGEIIIKLKIEWIDECSYRLTYLEGNDRMLKASEEDDEPIPELIVKIVNINKDSYLQEATFVGVDDFVYKSSIKKIE